MQQLVENVEYSFFWGLAHHTSFFQQVGLNIGATNEARVVEVDSDKFTLQQCVWII